MLVQTKVQMDRENYEFIKKVHKSLHYRSLSEYVREAVAAKVREDRKRLREQKRMEAMAMIAKGTYENHFGSIEGEDFEARRCLLGEP
jgi:Arc/MetJ-type ribon-helix-helix transcriptional regulator